MSIREGFVERFGEDNAAAIEAAAETHAYATALDDHPGSDPFRWALAICIGYECLSRFREPHGITADTEEMRQWVVEHGDLRSHDGAYDTLAAFLGKYQEWMQAEVHHDV